MKIDDIIAKKGVGVVTIASTATIAELLTVLVRHNIGAAVVSDDDQTILGIVSERDVIRKLADRGSGLLAEPVRTIMTSDVQTCSAEDNLEEIAHTMTYSRFRHLPVVDNGRLAGIVSLGDVVKHRIDQLTDERDHLIDYLHA